jgi:hypothetical protein
MRNKPARFIYLLLLMGCHTFCKAQTKSLNAVLGKILESPAANHRLGNPATHPRTYLVKLKPGIKKEALAQQGIVMRRTLGPGLIVIQASPDALPEALYEEKWPVNHLWKLSDDLLLHGDQTLQNYYTIKIAGLSAQRALAAIPGIEVVHSKNNIVTVFSSLETLLKHVILLEEVVYVGKESIHPHTESPVLDMILYANTVNRIHHLFPHLNGEGMTISIQEQQFDTEDIDFRGRLVPSSLSAPEISNHATEMATIAAGAGNSFITGKGVAWGASITSSAFGDLLPDEDEDYATLDTWVQNHSYGTVIEPFYGSRAEAFDQSANRNPRLLHVFSSGNEGMATSTTGLYQGLPGFANLTGNFKMAKNTLTVGSVDTVGRPISFSSRGPAYDGRIKPEVVAYSTAGSSNSAALVSGMVALLQQAHQQQEGNLPASALLKALLINSAQDAGPVGIDYLTGFGNVDGYRTVMNLREKHYFSGSIHQGESKDFLLRIPANARQLKVTVVWNDPAALANASLALVNDLDIRLKNPKGGTCLPWILDAGAETSRLTKAATRGEDHLNNVEQITVDQLVAGTYTISIKGFDVSSGPQRFYIAYQWDMLNQFEWSSPTGSDNMPNNGETDTYFLWKSTLADTIGRLEYTLDAGQTWHTLANSIDLTKGFYRWQVPEITAWTQARMVVGSTFYPSDYFSISRPLPITVSFNCADSVLIQWPHAEGIKEYEVSILEDKFMKPVWVTTDTAMVLKKDEIPSPFFAIQPMLKEGMPGLRARSIHYSTLNSSCFLASFYAEVVRDDGIDLVTQLGTTYGVKRILIERKKNDIFETIGTVQPEGTEIRFLDEHPAPGLNLHRVRVLLANGNEIVSEVVSSYFLTQTPFLVFPNPVSKADKLNIFSKEFTNQEVLFRLYGWDGKALLTTKLLSNRESVSLQHLSPGLYLYSIQTSERCFNGKVVIE